MAHNTLSGNIIAPSYFGPGDGILGTNILSGNLSTSDGASVINVPRLSNATDNSLITNVGGDANNLTCESNLTFDGSKLTIAGNISGSGQAQFGSIQIAGGLNLNRRTLSSTATASVNDYFIGLNSTGGAFEVRLPNAATLTNGQTYVIKDEAGTAKNNNITILAYGSQTIDGTNSVVLESPYGAFSLYCNGVDKFFVY